MEEAEAMQEHRVEETLKAFRRRCEGSRARDTPEEVPNAVSRATLGPLSSVNAPLRQHHEHRRLCPLPAKRELC
jgi:hypothetical protein